LLNFKMRQSSWNNIPTPLKEMFQFVVDFCVNQDIKYRERKTTTNERIINL